MFKPLILKEENKGTNDVQKVPSPKMINIEDAYQMAKEAGETASRETMESFNKHQQSQRHLEEATLQELDETGEGIGEGTREASRDPTIKFDRKTENQLMRKLFDKTIMEALRPKEPSPIENAVNQVMTEVSQGIASKMLGNVMGSGGFSSNKGVILSGAIDVLNTAFGHGLGETLGTAGAESIKTLIGSLGGGQNTKQLSDGTKSNSTNEKTKSENPDTSNAEKQKDQVLSLDSNNTEHVKQYASAMGLSEKAAKEMLTYHQNDIINERKASGTSNSNSNSDQVTQALTTLINEMSGIKNTISSLNNEILSLKNEKIKSSETSSKTSSVRIPDRWKDENETVPTGKSVTLFQEPIHVNVDEIKEENLKESFFDDKQSVKEAEFVDENTDENTDENIDENVDENIEEKDKSEQIVNEKGNFSSKVPPKVPSKVLDKTLDSEDNKKKEETNLVETQVEIQQINDNTSKIEPKIEVSYKKIIRKPIIREQELIKKEKNTKEEIVSNETISDTTLERYDINNNLIKEE